MGANRRRTNGRAEAGGPSRFGSAASRPSPDVASASASRASTDAGAAATLRRLEGSPVDGAPLPSHRGKRWTDGLDEASRLRVDTFFDIILRKAEELAEAR